MSVGAVAMSLSTAIIEELDAALESRERQPRTSVSVPTSERVSNRLLFVDDEKSIRMTMPLLLKECGFEVHVAARVPEALTAIGIQKFDVLLSDLISAKSVMDSRSWMLCAGRTPNA